MKLEWFVLEQENEKLPEWARSFAIAEDGTIFVPGALAGISEHEIFLCSCSDATRHAIHKNHRYFPSQWLAKEFPKSAEISSIIERRAKEFTETA